MRLKNIVPPFLPEEPRSGAAASISRTPPLSSARTEGYLTPNIGPMPRAPTRPQSVVAPVVYAGTADPCAARRAMTRQERGESLSLPANGACAANDCGMCCESPPSGGCASAASYRVYPSARPRGPKASAPARTPPESTRPPHPNACGAPAALHDLLARSSSLDRHRRSRQ